MRYYLFWFTDDVPWSACHARTLEGKEVRPWRSPRPWEVTQAYARIPQESELRDVLPGDDLPDYIFMGGVSLLLSLKCKMLLDELGVGTEVEFLSTRLVNRAGQDVADYFMAYSRHDHSNCLDLVNSEIEYYPAEVIYKVFRWAFRADSFPKSDLFRCEGKWIATERIKELFDAHGATGIHFIPIWSPEEGPLERIE